MDENLNVTSLLESMVIQLHEQLAARSIMHPKIVGIRSGGVWVAEHIKQGLDAAMSETHEIGELDISFYRDDFTQIGLNPKVSPSSLPFSTDGQHLILVDDVLMTGRTIRAAMNELFDYGRPASITLVTLIDLAQRELPIQPDVIGKTLHLAKNERIKLRGPERLELKIETKNS